MFQSRIEYILILANKLVDLVSVIMVNSVIELNVTVVESCMHVERYNRRVTLYISCQLGLVMYRHLRTYYVHAGILVCTLFYAISHLFKHCAPCKYNR